MPSVRKYDYPPLLPPGRHHLTLSQLWELCVVDFRGNSRSHREKLYYVLEQLVQDLLLVRIRCNVSVDGSFLTKKPLPSDVDAIVTFPSEIASLFTPEQRELMAPRCLAWVGGLSG